MSSLSPEAVPVTRTQRLTHSAAVAPLLIRQGKIRFRVVSDSMSPCLKAGDLVMLEPTDPKALRNGEIIVVSKGEALLCHRLVRWFEQEGARWVVTRGDRVWSEDTPVPIEQVVGRVVKIYKPRIFHRLVWRLKRGLGPFILPLIRLIKL